MAERWLWPASVWLLLRRMRTPGARIRLLARWVRLLPTGGGCFPVGVWRHSGVSALIRRRRPDRTRGGNASPRFRSPWLQAQRYPVSILGNSLGPFELLPGRH
jgi:hypothetical protein